MGIGIIIQARMGSTRLPGKILKKINDRVLLAHIIDRLSGLRNKVTVVVATSELERDNVVEQWCNEHKVKCFRGDEENVLKRYYDCATIYSFNHVVRMTADNPFPDIEELDKLIDYHIRENNDFSENFSQLPIGVGAEIFSFNTLADDMKNASQQHHFEHVDEYILENISQYKTGTLNVPEHKNHPDVRLTVDTEEDYKKACYIASNCHSGLASTEEAIKLCLQYV